MGPINCAPNPTAYQRDARMNIAVNQVNHASLCIPMNGNKPFHEKTCLSEF